MALPPLSSETRAHGVVEGVLGRPLLLPARPPARQLSRQAGPRSTVGVNWSPHSALAASQLPDVSRQAGHGSSGGRQGWTKGCLQIEGKLSWPAAGCDHRAPL